MDSILKKGLFLVTTAGAITAFPATAYASDTATDDVMPQMGIEEVLNSCYSSDKEIEVEDYLVPTEKGEYLDMAFANVDTFLYIRSEPTRESEWVGKLYPDYAAKILGPVGEWTRIESGSVTGYVCSEYIIVGNSAEQKAQEMVQSSEAENPTDAFTYAESKEEEEARLAREAEEAALRAQEEAAAKGGTGQAIVDFACQFIGNPYVWGGVGQALRTERIVQGLFSQCLRILESAFRGRRGILSALERRSAMKRRFRATLFSTAAM